MLSSQKPLRPPWRPAGTEDSVVSVVLGQRLARARVPRLLLRTVSVISFHPSFTRGLGRTGRAAQQRPATRSRGRLRHRDPPPMAAATFAKPRVCAHHRASQRNPNTCSRGIPSVSHSAASTLTHPTPTAGDPIPSREDTSERHSHCPPPARVCACVCSLDLFLSSSFPLLTHTHRFLFVHTGIKKTFRSCSSTLVHYLFQKIRQDDSGRVSCARCGGRRPHDTGVD